jgi:hypothetical protein
MMKGWYFNLRAGTNNLIQHSAGSCSQHNKARKGNKKHIEEKGKN